MSQKLTKKELAELETKNAEEVLEWTLKKYGSKIAFASSFGAEDVVLIDLITKICPKPHIFTLDTLRLLHETYEVMEKIKDKYGIDIEVYYPQKALVEKHGQKYGERLIL